MGKDIIAVRPPVQLLPKAVIAVRPASTAKADLEVMAALTPRCFRLQTI